MFNLIKSMTKTATKTLSVTNTKLAVATAVMLAAGGLAFLTAPVATSPDIIVSNAAWQAAGRSVQVLVQNTGRGALNQTFTIYALLQAESGGEIGYFENSAAYAGPAILPGQSQTLSLAFANAPIDGLLLQLSVTADIFDEVDEADEDNNFFGLDFGLSAGAIVQPESVPAEEAPLSNSAAPGEVAADMIILEETTTVNEITPDPVQENTNVNNNNQVAVGLGNVCAPPAPNMTFFVTHRGTEGNGGNLGGLAGADARCQNAAEAAGIRGRTWRAYLSAENDAQVGRVDAKDRIGRGPWTNHAGQSIGNLAAIHSGTIDAVPPARVLSECGAQFLSSRDSDLFERAHDIFTGSNQFGELIPEQTCADWTANSPNFTAWVGHTDHDVADDYWNSSHTTSCEPEGMASTLALGRVYCFAVN